MTGAQPRFKTLTGARPDLSRLLKRRQARSGQGRGRRQSARRRMMGSPTLPGSFIPLGKV
jgi:hypothetical protein